MAAGDMPSSADTLRAGGVPLPAATLAGDAALTPVAVERIASGFCLRYGKRVFDVVAATLMLVVLLPVAAIVASACWRHPAGRCAVPVDQQRAA